MSELTVRWPSGTRNEPGWGLWPNAWMLRVCGRVAWSADAGSAMPTTRARAPTSTAHRLRDWRIRDRTAPTSLWVERPEAVDVERRFIPTRLPSQALCLLVHAMAVPAGLDRPTGGYGVPWSGWGTTGGLDAGTCADTPYPYLSYANIPETLGMPFLPKRESPSSGRWLQGVARLRLPRRRCWAARCDPARLAATGLRLLIAVCVASGSRPEPAVPRPASTRSPRRRR